MQMGNLSNVSNNRHYVIENSLTGASPPPINEDLLLEASQLQPELKLTGPSAFSGVISLHSPTKPRSSNRSGMVPPPIPSPGEDSQSSKRFAIYSAYQIRQFKQQGSKEYPGPLVGKGMSINEGRKSQVSESTANMGHFIMEDKKETGSIAEPSAISYLPIAPILVPQAVIKNMSKPGV
jgi:hypothetical protein